MQVRPAFPCDEPEIGRAVSCLLHDIPDGEILPTERSIAGFTARIMRVVRGDSPGAVVVADEVDGRLVGLSAAEGHPFDVDLKSGATAAGIGTWVDTPFRGNGLATRLREMLCTALAEMGFLAIVGFVDVANEAGLASAKSIGFRPTQILGVKELC